MTGTTAGFGAETAPAEVLEALRQIDPTADLVHVHGRTWLLGTRRPNPGAQARIQKQLRLLEPHRLTDPTSGLEFQLLQFYAGGFNPISMYELGTEGRDEAGQVAQIDFSYIVEDFRIRDFNWRVRPKEAEAEFLDAISLDAGNRRRAALMAEFADQEAGSLFRHVMRRARSFLQRVAIPTGGHS